MVQEIQDIERMFDETYIAFKNDNEVWAMIQCAERLWKGGDTVAAYWILNAFSLGFLRAGREEIHQNVLPLKQAIHSAFSM